MTNYTDLVHILRQLNLKYGDMAADAIEALEVELSNVSEWATARAVVLEQLAEANTRIAELEDSIDKNDEWTKWFIEKTDARIAELEAALKPFADASEIHLGSDDMSIAFRIIIGNLRQARKVLGEKE